MTTADEVTGGELAGGHVREQWHPSLPLRILNYTERAVYEREWNAATPGCRGLVVHADGTVVARPWRKFFNSGEPGVPAIGPDESVTVTDKIDGSLGVLHPTAAPPRPTPSRPRRRDGRPCCASCLDGTPPRRWWPTRTGGWCSPPWRAGR